MLVRFEIPPRTRHSIHKDNSRTTVSFASHFPLVSAFGLDTYSVKAMVSLSSFMSQAKSSVLDCPWFFGCFSVYWLRALYKFPFPPFFIASQQVHYVKKPVLPMVSWKKRYFAFNLLCIGNSLKQLSSVRLLSQFAYTVCSNLGRQGIVAGWVFWPFSTDIWDPPPSQLS